MRNIAGSNVHESRRLGLLNNESQHATNRKTSELGCRDSQEKVGKTACERPDLRYSIHVYSGMAAAEAGVIIGEDETEGPVQDRQRSRLLAISAVSLLVVVFVTASVSASRPYPYWSLTQEGLDVLPAPEVSR